MRKIKWTQPTGSGLCDRLIDLMLMSAYANVHDADLYLDWIQGAQRGINQWTQKGNEIKQWADYRYEDYKYENYIEYFTLPTNIKITKNVNEECINPEITFDSYLGGVFSPHSFHEKFLKYVISLEDFLKIFEETIAQFKPTEKLLDLVKHLEKPKVAVHLRRADKVRVDSDKGSINYQELQELNKKTFETLDKLIEGTNSKILITSDEEEEKRKYEEKYPHLEDVHKFIPEDKSYVKTYVDIYMLSQADYIILSQKHSNFSLLASLLNKSKLVYFFEECNITVNNFNLLNNIIYYKNL